MRVEQWALKFSEGAGNAQIYSLIYHFSLIHDISYLYGFKEACERASWRWPLCTRRLWLPLSIYYMIWYGRVEDRILIPRNDSHPIPVIVGVCVWAFYFIKYGAGHIFTAKLNLRPSAITSLDKLGQVYLCFLPDEDNGHVPVWFPSTQLIKMSIRKAAIQNWHLFLFNFHSTRGTFDQVPTWCLCRFAQLQASRHKEKEIYINRINWLLFPTQKEQTSSGFKCEIKKFADKFL